MMHPLLCTLSSSKWYQVQGKQILGCLCWHFPVLVRVKSSIAFKNLYWQLKGLAIGLGNASHKIETSQATKILQDRSLTGSTDVSGPKHLQQQPCEASLDRPCFKPTSPKSTARPQAQPRYILSRDAIAPATISNVTVTSSCHFTGPNSRSARPAQPRPRDPKTRPRLPIPRPPPESVMNFCNQAGTPFLNHDRHAETSSMEHESPNEPVALANDPADPAGIFHNMLLLCKTPKLQSHTRKK
ncbi:hypothetical protein SELMODRAFT_419159 [Selaginella moellendorffii]|uniref:Uncharacterized protein n=1 Tax=Selaginella moellendorffii TaxID=88036 RepID=D8S819_SELML|nr:hypothetical protein SELMODRAFT_419159 [Selaginella moellendorffii]